MNDRPQNRSAMLLLAGLVAMLPVVAGCYDAHALAAATRKNAESLALDKVDVGVFHVTLPQKPGESAPGVVDFHAFAKTARRNQSQVEKVLKIRGPEIRANILVAVRSLKAEQLAEPTFVAVRRELVEVMPSGR